MKKFKFIAFAFVAMLMTFMASSCGKDEESDPPVVGGLNGTWFLEETSESGSYSNTLRMTLTFRDDHTGSIVENWTTVSRASENNTYAMEFSWSSTSDSNGNDILRVSYVSGDKNTEIFAGDSNTVLWTRQYVVTGNILNIYQGGGVWVFHRI